MKRATSRNNARGWPTLLVDINWLTNDGSDLCASPTSTRIFLKRGIGRCTQSAPMGRFDVLDHVGVTGHHRLMELHTMIVCPLIVAAVLGASTDGPVLIPAVRSQLRPGDFLAAVVASTDPVLIGHGPAKWFEFVAATSGRVTIVLDSYDFDPFLRVTTKDGLVVAAAGVAPDWPNARLTLPIEAGIRIVIAAASNSDRGGNFAISMAEGQEVFPPGAAARDSAIEYHRRAIAALTTRGLGSQAMFHHYETGIHLSARSRYAEALAEYEQAYQLARECGNSTLEFKALLSGASHRAALGDMAASWLEIKRGIGVAFESGDRAAIAAAALFLGNTAFTIRRSAPALALYRRALTRAVESGDAKTLQSAILGIGRALYVTGEPIRARRCLQRALELARRQSDLRGESECAHWLGEAHLFVQDIDDAALCFQREREIANLVGDQSAETAALAGLGSVARRSGRLKDAWSCFCAVLRSARQVGDRTNEASALCQLGEISRLVGNPPLSRALMQKSLEVSRRNGLPASEAAALTVLGNLSLDDGDLDAAEAYGEKVTQFAESSGDVRLQGTGWIIRGDSSARRGDLARAADFFDKAVRSFERIGDVAGRLRATEYLGMVEMERENDARAHAIFKTALTVASEVGSIDGRLTALANVGAIYGKSRAFAIAASCFQEAFRLAMAFGDVRSASAAIGNLGVAYVELDQRERALSCFAQQLELAKRSGDQELVVEAIGRTASIHLAAGELELAKQLASAALAAATDSPFNFSVAEPLWVLCRVAISNDDLLGLSAAYERGARLLARITHNSTDASNELRRLTADARWAQLGQDYTKLRLAHLNAQSALRVQVIRQGFEDAGRWKGRILLGGIEAHHSGATSAEVVEVRNDVKAIHEKVSAIEEQISVLMSRADGIARADLLKKQADELLAREHSLLDRLARIAPRIARHDHAEMADLHEISDVLDDRTALIEYASGSDHLFAYVVTKTRLSWNALGETTEIDRDASLYVSHLSSPPSESQEPTFVSIGQTLYDRIVGPLVVDLDPRIDRLVIIPTQTLSSLPFEAIVLPNGSSPTPRRFREAAFLIDRFEVLYAPSSRVLLGLASLSQTRLQGRVLLLADPLYRSELHLAVPAFTDRLHGDLFRDLPDGRMLGRLESTRNEALEVAAIIDRSSQAAHALALVAANRSGHLSTEFFDLFLGAEASPGRLTGCLHEYSIIHLAAHGYVDQESPKKCGVALAFTHDSDGYLSVSKVLDLDLDADLVVLSGCDTARGSPRVGEGVESLAWAFIHAGTRGVVASEWKVEDAVAAQTMEEFYRGVIERHGVPARALREAKLAIRGGHMAGLSRFVDYSHPFYWAPFIYIGAPR
ncbi:MAG: CHAT domain-containing protein [Planctomycetes bacterium]|nr:CHAT domain-containing protein [Planctomycetota bacterium]